MNKLILIGAFLLSLSSFASVELKVGDVLLQPLKCWSCRLIEEQENSIYSHMGIIVAVKPEVLVAEALGKVRVVSLREFNARTRKDRKLSVRRLVRSDAVKLLQENQDHFIKMYYDWFDGALYDHAFLWNNTDADGYEMFYCSEFVTKFLRGFLGIEIPTKIMRFDKNREEWFKFFNGTPPDGKVGNSPASFEKTDLYYEVGEL